MHRFFMDNKMSTNMKNNGSSKLPSCISCEFLFKLFWTLALCNTPDKCTNLGLGRLIPTICHYLFSSFMLWNKSWYFNQDEPWSCWSKQELFHWFQPKLCWAATEGKKHEEFWPLSQLLLYIKGKKSTTGTILDKMTEAKRLIWVCHRERWEKLIAFPCDTLNNSNEEITSTSLVMSCWKADHISL